MGYRQTQEQYPFISCYHRGLSKVLTKNGERLYIDESGKTVLTVPSNINKFCGGNKPYTCWGDNKDIDFFLDYGLVLIKQGENEGVANKNGKIIVPQKNRNKDISDITVFPKEHTILVNEHQGPVVVNGPDAGEHYSIYDFNGNIVSKFKAFSARPSREEAEEGLIHIRQVQGSNQMVGYLNAKGQTVVLRKGNDVSGGTVKYSGEGMIQVSDPDNDNFCGFVDKTGALVIPYEYDCSRYGSPVRDGVIKVRQGNDEFYINKQGQRVEDPGW